MATIKDYFAQLGAQLGRVPTLEDVYKQEKALTTKILGPPDTNLERQRDLSQAQALFDVARLGLAFAAPTKEEIAAGRRFSPAERLAQSAQETKFFESIGARAADLEKVRRADQATQRALDLSSLERASQTRLKRLGLAADVAKEISKQRGSKGTDKFGTLEVPGEPPKILNLKNPKDLAEVQEGMRKNGQFFLLRKKPTGDKTAQKSQNITVKKGDKILRVTSVIPGSPEDKKIREEAARLGADVIVTKELSADPPKLGDPKNFTITEQDGSRRTIALRPGSEEYTQAFREAKERGAEVRVGEGGTVVFTPYILTEDVPGIGKRGQTSSLTSQEVSGLSRENRSYLKKVEVTDEDYFRKYGMSREQFNALPDTEKRVLQGLGPTIKLANGQIFSVKAGGTSARRVVDASDKPKPNLKNVTINGKTTVFDLNSENGQKVLANVQAANEKKAGSATITNLRTAPDQMAFLLPNEARIVYSYDGGKTYRDDNGEIKELPPERVEVDKATAVETYNTAKFRKATLEKLRRINLIQAKKRGRVRVGAITNNTNTTIAGFKPGKSTDVISEADADIIAKIETLAELGLGTGPRITAFFDDLSGAVPDALIPDFFEKYALKVQDARQYFKTIQQVGKYAMVGSNRYPVAELTSAGNLFSNADAFFRNPKSEFNKLRNLKRLAIEQLTFNTEKLLDPYLSAKVKSEINTNNFQVERLLMLLKGVREVNPQSKEGDEQREEALKLFIN